MSTTLIPVLVMMVIINSVMSVWMIEHLHACKLRAKIYSGFPQKGLLELSNSLHSVVAMVKVSHV